MTSIECIDFTMSLSPIADSDPNETDNAKKILFELTEDVLISMETLYGDEVGVLWVQISNLLLPDQ